MGIFKKIFKPISKVLDKIIPNEIKPALPYAAAFAPYMFPGMGAAGIGGLSPMMTRALMSGGLNVGAQLAQEGSEGDINLLSAGLGALQGAMTTPGASEKFLGMRYGTPNVAENVRGAKYLTGGLDQTGITGLQRAANIGLQGLSKGSEFMQAPGLTKYSIPAAQATGDLLYAEGKRLEDDEGEEVVEETGYTDAAYRAAIRKSMEAYGAEEEEILAAIEAAGYRSGGRVGLLRGGDPEQEDVSILELQKEEGVPIGPQVQADKQQLLLKAFADYQAGGGTLSFKQFSALWMRENAAQGGLMNAKRGLVDGPGGYAGESQQNKFNFDDTFSLWERLNPRDPENELIAEHMQIGKLPFNITARILELNRGGKSYEDIAEITGVDIEDITSMLEVANNPDSIDPVDEQGKVDYDLWDEIVKERDQIRERPEHLSYNAKGGRVGLAFGGIKPAVEKVNEEVIEEKKDGMLMEIAKVLFRLTPPGMFIFAADEAMDMYQKLDDDDKETVQDIGKKGLRFAGLPGMAASAGMSMYDKFTENKMADGGVPSVLPKGIEADYRGGGFIPIGSKERADDVPARLSENEFVMTADAVRAAGGGNVNKGAQRMYNVMNNLEARA